MHGVDRHTSARSESGLDRGHGVKVGRVGSVTRTCERWCAGMTPSVGWLVDSGDGPIDPSPKVIYIYIYPSPEPTNRPMDIYIYI
jgi:hypothetical protein